MTADFDELVDLTGTSPEERARLLRIHELLLLAGPPADLPVALRRPPSALDEPIAEAAEPTAQAVEHGATVIPFPPGGRRRAGVAVLIAATVAAACFGGGYVLANQTHGSSSLQVVRVVQLQGKGQQNSEAALRVGSADESGNWPIQLTVNGLKPLPNKARYYLMVFQNGKPAAFCGTFEVGKTGATTVTFNVAYKITKSTRWVVTEMAPGMKYPGHVVMTTS